MHGLIGKGELKGPTLDVAMLFQGDFGVAAVLISFGALIGKVCPALPPSRPPSLLTCVCVLPSLPSLPSSPSLPPSLKGPILDAAMLFQGDFGVTAFFWGIVCSVLEGGREGGREGGGEG